MTGRASVLRIGGSNTPTSGQEPSMSDKPISDLRRRMIADMTVRSFGDKTQRDYIRHIEMFARFLGRSPDTTTGDDPPFPACAGRAGRAATEDECTGFGLALLLHHHARPRRPRPSAGSYALARISHTNRAHRGSESAKVVVLQRLLDDSRGAPMPSNALRSCFSACKRSRS